ncbi:glycosyltransferase family 2 protein [Roseovarius sp. Pro17]|uniref:glycosyltransferase family 2 protein n=1 Tax=Roseovarius sp. Pro17 TaxID=3108175 RepID=UPI002D794946|nr:glycosyltransferase [Roseovarius sp. Pro17]
MTVLISIVIPTYRRIDLIKNLLSALRTQIASAPDAAAFEVLVVDNCQDQSAQHVVAEASDIARYIHEPRKGVANARNAGTADARGQYILFIDDDELPADGWLEAFRQQALNGHDASFGPIDPLFETPPQPETKAILERMFSRHIPAQTGADISQWRAHLGSGNSMFKKSSCFRGESPFDTRFNDGGEDVWLLRQLVDDHGIRLTWCAGALVYEIVPEDRMTNTYIAARKFKDGQLRCRIEAGAGGVRGLGRVSLWMMAGLIQFSLYGIAMLCFQLMSRERAAEMRMKMAGGAGKLLWWRLLG